MTKDLINTIRKGIELDIKNWEQELKNSGYSEEDVQSLLSKLSPETVESIKENPDKVAKIIEKLMKETKEDEHYKSDELGKDVNNKREERQKNFMKQNK